MSTSGTGFRVVGQFTAIKIRSAPFVIDEGNKIIYCTNYNHNDKTNSGIFEYDLKNNTHQTIKLFDEISFHIQFYATIYIPNRHSIYFIGGGKLNHYDFDCKQSISMYHIKNKTMKNVHFDTAVGGNPRLAVTNNDKYLHIIGGNVNNHHIIYDLATKKSKLVHSFRNTHPFILCQGLVYNKLTNKLIMMGGYSYINNKTIYHDDFQIMDINNINLLSMDERAQYLVSGYMQRTFLKNNKTLNIEPLNNIIFTYLGNDINYNVWQSEEKRRMKQKSRSFGYVLYDDRIIITFGGLTEGRKLMDNIYYIDLSGNESWKEASIKCPKPGVCHALLINDTIHIIPYGSYSDHFSIDIQHLLPSNLLKND